MASPDNPFITLNKSLDGLGKKGPKIVRRALRDGAKVVQEEMISSAPVASGLTKQSVKVRAGKSKRRGVISVIVGVGKKWFSGPTFYVAFVEFGHRIGRRLAGKSNADANTSRPMVPGRHWLETAFNRSKSAAASVVATSLKKGIEDAVKEARVEK